jgi:hypothetical protein
MFNDLGVLHVQTRRQKFRYGLLEVFALFRVHLIVLLVVFVERQHSTIAIDLRKMLYGPRFAEEVMKESMESSPNKTLPSPRAASAASTLFCRALPRSKRVCQTGTFSTKVVTQIFGITKSYLERITSSATSNENVNLIRE